MGLFESALVSACVASSGSNMSQIACEKASEAGGKQTGIEQRANDIENKAIKALESRAVEALGKKSVNIVAGSVFFAKTLQSRAITFGLPTFGMCSSLKTEINPDQSLLKFEWNF